MRLARRLRAERSDETLGLSQMSALASLMHGPLSPTALAQMERIQPPSMTRVITALETRGLIKREEHETDRRQSVIAITDTGRQIVEEDRVRRKAWLVEVLDTLEEDDRRALREALPVLERITNS
jgi:DNA-binding MarR family transcriptional regulator